VLLLRRPVGGFLALTVSSVVVAYSQGRSNPQLPTEAIVIERAVLPRSVHADREILLWMIAPTKHDRGEFSESNPYTCPERTLGSYYRGPTRVSLIDARSGKIINTIILRHSWGDEDSFDIPYRILVSDLYAVPGKPPGAEGKPMLLMLRDITGQGLPLAASFYEAEACMGLLTTTIGYSVKRDILIQYQAELNSKTQEIVEGRGIVDVGKAAMETTSWIDHLFSEKPAEPGHWSYKIDYRGRGGPLDSYDIRYDASKEEFVGTLDQQLAPGLVQVSCSVDMISLTDFLKHIQKVATVADKEIEWLRGLIAENPRSHSGSAALVPTFKGRIETLDISFQLSTTGTIEIDFVAATGFAAALRGELGTSCNAN
jgi:hypothetical protein